MEPCEWVEWGIVDYHSESVSHWAIQSVSVIFQAVVTQSEYCFFFEKLWHQDTYFATFQVVSSVREEEGYSLQLAVTGSHALSRVPAAGQHNKVVCGDGDVCTRKKPRVPQKCTQSLASWYWIPFKLQLNSWSQIQAWSMNNKHKILLQNE